MQPTQPYELLVTAVSERADLFAQSLDSLIVNVDQQPSRVIVHEDVRPGSASGAIESWLKDARTTGKIADFKLEVTSPARGLGPALLRVLQMAKTPIVLYTQEDWLAVRPIPVSQALSLMLTHGLYHIRFNKRKTMKAKHADTAKPWYKVETQYATTPQGGLQTLCISDHWYTQTSLWRVDQALPGVAAVAQSHPQANAFVARFNDWMNAKHGDGKRPWNDQAMRGERLKTFIWGPVGEPAFIKHLGSARTTGPIVHVNELKGVR